MGVSSRSVAYVGIGTNLGDRVGRLGAALEGLRGVPGVESVEISPVYETDPVGGPPGQGPYLNAVVCLRTTLSPRTLLERLLALERAAGRVRRGERNAPRSLDLDLLLHGELRVDEPDLVVPHPRLAERAFVLAPLCDLAPGLVHPVLGVSIAELASRVHDPVAVRPFACEGSLV